MWEFLLESFGPVFDVVSQSGKTIITAANMRDFFEQAFSRLAEIDGPEWRDWVAKMDEGNSVNTELGEVTVGKNKKDASPSSARGSIAHEIFGHGIRAKNGAKRDDQILTTGLTGYLDAEEGLGVLYGYAMSGELSDNSKDYYTNIAMAMGLVGQPRTRQEMVEIQRARNIVRAQSRGTYDISELPQLERSAWAVVDRIYRGGKGDEYGAVQAVFTKDVAYYGGFKLMLDYFTQQLKAGKKIEDIFRYLSEGRFDPTNVQHVAYMAKVANATAP